MNVNTQVLDYNALTICIYNPINKCDNYLWHLTYWCCYYGNVSVALLLMCIRDLPDMNALIPQPCGPWVSGIAIYQANTSCPCYN